jgi:hypothetical protein
MTPPTFDNDTGPGCPFRGPVVYTSFSPSDFVAYPQGRTTPGPSGAAGGGGAQTLEDWLRAVAAVRPRSHLRNAIALQAAINLIHDTPFARRSEFALEIQRRKRARQHVAAAAV